jgi:hypothetical protein
MKLQSLLDNVLKEITSKFEIKSNTGLSTTELTNVASSFQSLFKQFDATKELDVMERTYIRYQISDRMKDLNKTLSPLIADLKAVNEPVGAKLEEMFRRELLREQSRDTGRGMEM